MHSKTSQCSAKAKLLHHFPPRMYIDFLLPGLHYFLLNISPRQKASRTETYNGTAVLANSDENYINLIGRDIKHPSFGSD